MYWSRTLKCRWLEASLHYFCVYFREKPIQQHLKQVYSCLAICMLVAGAGGYVHLFTNIMQVRDQSVWIPRGGGVSAAHGFWQLSDNSRKWFLQWCSDLGAVLTFKINRFPPSWVGNRGDSDTKGANEGGDFHRRNVQMSESPGSAHGVPGDGLVHKGTLQNYILHRVPMMVGN